MLILQITLGIVLSVIIISFPPQILVPGVGTLKRTNQILGMVVVFLLCSACEKQQDLSVAVRPIIASDSSSNVLLVRANELPVGAIPAQSKSSKRELDAVNPFLPGHSDLNISPSSPQQILDIQETTNMLSTGAVANAPSSPQQSPIDLTGTPFEAALKNPPTQQQKQFDLSGTPFEAAIKAALPVQPKNK